MIFFYEKISVVRDADQLVEIKVTTPVLDTSINQDHIRLYSWNEIKYQKPVTNETVKITSLAQLKNAIIEIAKQDSICKSMNNSAYKKYGIFMFEPDGYVITNSVDMTELINRTIMEQSVWCPFIDGMYILSGIMARCSSS